MAYDVGMVMRRHDCYGHCRDTTMDTEGTLLWTLDSWVVCKLIPTNWTHSPSLSLSRWMVMTMPMVKNRIMARSKEESPLEVREVR